MNYCWRVIMEAGVSIALDCKVYVFSVLGR